MQGFKTAFRFAKLSVLGETKSPNFYLVLLIVFFMIQYNFSGISSFLYANGDKMNVFEFYIFFMSTPQSQLLYFVGLLLLSCGVLFYNSGAAYYLIRADREKWIMGQLLYLISMVVFYNVFILGTLCTACGGNLTLKNGWSEASFIMGQYSPESLGVAPIIAIPYRLLQMPPVTAGILTFILAFFIGLSIGSLMIFTGIRNRTVQGISLLVILWFIDFLVDAGSPNNIFNYFSPFGMSRISRTSLNAAGPSAAYAFLFLFFLMLAGMYALLRTAKKIDFIKIE